MSFSPTGFITGLSKGHLPTEEDEDNFELYTTQLVLEYDLKSTKMREKTNTEEYFKLPKKLQAHSFDGLVGKRIYMRFDTKSDEIINKLKKDIEGYMAEYELDYQTAKYLVMTKKGNP